MSVHYPPCDHSDLTFQAKEGRRGLRTPEKARILGVQASLQADTQFPLPIEGSPSAVKMAEGHFSRGFSLHH